MTRELLERVLNARPLSAADAERLVERFEDSKTPDTERAALLVALRGRPESVEELATFAQAMLRRASPFEMAGVERAIDLGGSGGSARPTFNVSTVSAFVVAAAGQPVVKVTNRSTAGPCGSSDLLEALGLPVTHSRAFSEETFRRFGLAFLHAPLFHASTRAVADVTRELGIRTIFDRLGPLVNPARVPYQLVGVPDRPSCELVANALVRLGVQRGITVSGGDGYDEFSPSGPNFVYGWEGRVLSERHVDATKILSEEDREGEWGPLPPPAAAREAARVLAGGGGARRGAILLTSGAALWVSGTATTFRKGLESATLALDGGAAEELFQSVRELSASNRWG
ncbi:MAG: anthranilate phosphoribosyltransferase [Thermoplasmata archaeon]|nr:anthranilate phosphoribosyltransferase [Thermoplasmata archaeon]